LSCWRCWRVLPTAQPITTAEDFEAEVAGRTLFFDRGDGGEAASETYLNDRRVRWSIAPGDCVEGDWFARDGLICFSYETSPEPQCWSVERGPDGIIARLAGDDPVTLTEIDPAGREQSCPGPRVGV
jgi:hypothetical protein